MSSVALAGLLHDIGKFSQRVGNEQRWRHEAFTENFLQAFATKLGEEAQRIQDLAAAPHRQVRERLPLCVKLADWLASAERQRFAEQFLIPPERSALISLPSRVELAQKPPSPAFLPLLPLRLTEEAFFPSDAPQVEEEAYRRAWDCFAETLRNLPEPLPFLVWQTLLQVYTHAIPSATPWEREPQRRTLPDISLFYHAKLTAAIAACLAASPEETWPTCDLLALRDLLSQFEAPDFLARLRQESLAQRPLCLLVRGDVAGIQGWLYRIARAEGEEHRRTAKRLRGRSFFLVLLTEAIAQWLRRQAKMPPCNLLFCGGGVFDVLVPTAMEPSLPQWEQSLSEGLLKEFQGDLHVHLAWVPVAAIDFYEFGQLQRRLFAALERKKGKVFLPYLDCEEIWFTEAEEICHFCDTTPFSSPDQPCPQCALQGQLGDALGRPDQSEFLLWAFDEAQKALAGRGTDEPLVAFPNLGCSVALVAEGSAQDIVQRWDGKGELVVAKRNDLQNWWRPLAWDGQKPVQATIWWAASDAPLANKEWRAPTKPAHDPEARLRPGEMLDFEEIAALSQGDDLLGVLRMDVDHLGAVFALGVNPPSPSRLAELSGRMDTFFSGWLLQRCRLLTERWQEELPEEDKRKGLVDNAFYLVYAGGDDLMVLGPWNLTLWLAWHIHKDFTRFCGRNPNMTISAGIVFVKPKFPIHRFAESAGKALEQAKEEGRNRITAFQTTVTWEAYRKALEFGRNLAQAVEDRKVPRTFLHFLWRLYRTHVREEGTNPMWAPLLHYMVARRLEEETVEDLQLLHQVPQLLGEKALPIALGYAILATREGLAG